MKKNPPQKREPKKLRRLTLSRETIQRLDEPQLLELAQGGGGNSLIGNDPTTTWNSYC